MEPSQIEAIRQPTAFLWAESDDPELLKRVREVSCYHLGWEGSQPVATEVHSKVELQHIDPCCYPGARCWSWCLQITDNKSDVPTLVKLYPGTKHGFGIRGTWDNTKAADDPSNSATTAAAQEAFADASGFFSKYNFGSPSWVQKGGPAALVAGVAVLAICAVKAWQRNRQ